MSSIAITVLRRDGQPFYDLILSFALCNLYILFVRIYQYKCVK